MKLSIERILASLSENFLEALREDFEDDTDEWVEAEVTETGDQHFEVIFGDQKFRVTVEEVKS